MSQINSNRFFANLEKASKEEEVKNAYAKFFDLDYNTSNDHDLYTTRVLFEFKNDKNFKNIKELSKIIGQTLYYVRRLKFGGFIEKPIPPMLCLADKNEALLTETSLWKDFYDDVDEKYDWDLAPSNPDKKLVDDISKTKLVNEIHVYNITITTDFTVFSEQLSKYLNNQIGFEFEDKKVITEDNFEDVFEYWNRIFGDSVRNGFKTSQYFVCDIQKDKTRFLESDSKVIFMFNAGDTRIKKILAKDYEHFWSLYNKVTNIDTIRAILAKIDRLTDDKMRRFHGEFFTPVKFANKALDYIERTIEKNWWKNGDYRLWDMAAGTGNLEYYLPQDALPYCYLSTLYPEEKEYIDGLFPDATVFQYDYLNDDIENLYTNQTQDKTANTFAFDKTWILPEKLRNDLNNPKIKWIVLINPPFATAQPGKTASNNYKTDVGNTKIRKVMHHEKLGEVSRELFSQFIFRIKTEFENKMAHLGLFSKIKYINSSNDFKLREKVFDFSFERGFLFSSVNFDGTSRASQFPVGFLIWNLLKSEKLENQNIIVDVFNTNVEKTEQKILVSGHKDQFLSKWITRPTANIKFPPFSSAITIKPDNQDRRDRVSEGFLASFMCQGNDFQCQNQTSFLSGPYVSAGALSVTPENFEQAMVVHAVRRIPKATWLNDRDQFLQPNKSLSQEFTNDCIVWSLFSDSNNTVAMKNVQYEDTVYQVHNHFFPFEVQEVKKWRINDTDILATLATAKNTYVADWLKNNDLSEEAQKVIIDVKEIYQFYFANLNQMRSNKFKIETYDAGFWQIKKAMEDVNLYKEEMNKFKITMNLLKEKLLPQLVDFGFVT
jgi:hypothetical protein